MSTPQRTFRERMLDPKNRRSKNIEDRTIGKSPRDSAGYPVGYEAGAKPNINEPIFRYGDYPSTRDPYSAAMDRFRAVKAVENRADAEPRRPRRRVKFPSPSKPK